MKQRVAVIGSGLAGTAVAELLCREGWRVTLIDRASGPASDGSGNPAGITMPYLSPAKHNMQRVYSVATDIAWRSMRGLFDMGLLPSWNPCGAIEVPAEERIRILIRSECDIPGARQVSAEVASEILGLKVSQRCLYMERAAVVCPIELCKAHITSAGPNLEQLFGREVESIECRKGIWRVLHADKSPICEADALVVANAGHCTRFAQTSSLPLETLRGEVALVAANDTLKAMRSAFCFQGYFLPQIAGQMLLGATFAPQFSEFDQDKYQELFTQLLDWLPGLKASDLQAAAPRTSYRSSTFDRLPFIGAVPGHPGLYVSVGHGTRGISSAHLAAHMLKDLINTNGTAGHEEIFELLSPARIAQH